MSCEPWRDAISAVADGEDPGLDLRLVDAHVARCPRCRTFRDVIDQPPPEALLRPAVPMPDLSRRITRLAALADRRSARAGVRMLLALVALVILAGSLPDLLLGEEGSASTHATRHLGAFTVAYAVGLFVVVARPARARTMLPVASVLAVALVLTAVIDLVGGRVPLISESQHLLEVASVLLVWILTAPRRPLDERRGAAPAELHPVDDPVRHLG